MARPEGRSTRTDRYLAWGVILSVVGILMLSVAGNDETGPLVFSLLVLFAGVVLLLIGAVARGFRRV